MTDMIDRLYRFCVKNSVSGSLEYCEPEDNWECLINGPGKGEFGRAKKMSSPSAAVDGAIEDFVQRLKPTTRSAF